MAAKKKKKPSAKKKPTKKKKPAKRVAPKRKVAKAKKKAVAKPKAKAKTKPKAKAKPKTKATPKAKVEPPPLPILPPPSSEAPSVAKRAAMADDGATVDAEDRWWTAGAHAEEIGPLDIPSGKVMVCDAGTLFAPVGVNVPKGTYDVRVGNADYENFAAALVANGAKPMTWTKVGTYGVDAGMSGFFDGDLLARLDKHQFPISIYDDLISNHLDPAETEGHAGAFCPFEESKFSACRSGDGDGVYPVFAGKDASGTVVAVVTLFLF